MNLKDRMNYGLQNSKPTETELSKMNENKQSLNDTTQKLNQQSAERELLEKQSEALKLVTAQRDKLMKEGRPEDQKTIQKLSSQVSELTSVITELKTELSETQRINQSLSQNNDDLRNNKGLKSRKQQEELEAKLAATQTLNAKLNDMIDKSSVEAVDNALAERDRALYDMKKGIRDAKAQASHDIYETHKYQKEAEKKAADAVNKLNTNSFLYIGLLAFTLLCQCIMNRQVVIDFIDFFKVPTIGLYSSLCVYIDWLISLSNKMDLWLAWVIRISLTLVIITITVGIVRVGIYFIEWYKKRWCTLSLKVAVCTIGIIAVFGMPIRRFLPINLILLFFIIQVCYLFVLWYFDGYYANRYRTDEWEKIQNS